MARANDVARARARARACGDVPSLAHDVQPGKHLDSEAPRRRLRNVLEVAGALDCLVPLRVGVATNEPRSRVHTSRYLDAVRDASRDGGMLLGGTVRTGRDGFDIAALAPGACVAAADALLASRCDNAYALVRPAGNQAGRERAEGGCVFNNVCGRGRSCARRRLDARSDRRLGRSPRDRYPGGVL